MDWNYAPRGGDCQLNAPKPSAFSPQAGAAPLMCDIQAWQEIDPPQIPRLRFVYGDTCAARYPSATFAALKTGKSLLALSEAIDAATARRFLTGKPSAPIKVLRYNAKDELAVIQGRVAAVLQAWQIPQSEIISRLFPVSGVAGDSRVVLTRGEKGDIFGSAFLALADLINREGVALAIFDPLQDLSHSPETNEVFRALASEIGATIGLIHHTRKPTSAIAPNPDDGRVDRRCAVWRTSTDYWCQRPRPRARRRVLTTSCTISASRNPRPILRRRHRIGSAGLRNRAG